MRRHKIKKFFKVKAVVIAALFIVALLVLQTPWFKNQVAQRILARLSTLTESEISYRYSDGFFPLSFDLYNVEFKREGKVWLEIQEMNLNRSLFNLMVLKKQHVHMTIEGATLLELPGKSLKKDTLNFPWPEIPYKRFAIDITATNINVSDSVFDKHIPQNIDLTTSLRMRRSGSNLSLKSQLSSRELPDVSVLLSGKGSKQQENLKLDFSVSDSRGQLGSYFTPYTLPAMEFEAHLQGHPDAFIAFFKPEMSVHSGFQGDVDWRLEPRQSLVIWTTLSDQNPVQYQAQISFDQKGLVINKMSLKGKHLDFEGSGKLSRNYRLSDTALTGEISNLAFIEELLEEKLEGKLKTTVALSGPYNEPHLQMKLNSERLTYKQFVIYEIDSLFNLDPYQNHFVGDYQVSASINQSPLSSKGNFSYANVNHFDLSDVHVKYGNNAIDLHSLTKLDQFYQMHLNFDAQKIALFSPFVQREIHGDMKGEAKLDLDIHQAQFLQTLSLKAKGSNFQHPLFNMSDYDIEFDGKPNWKKISLSKGELSLISQSTTIKNDHFEQFRLFVQTNNNEYLYKVQTKGELAFNSSGLIIHDDSKITANIREFSGYVFDTRVLLTQPTTITYEKDHLEFDSIYLRASSGNLALVYEKQKDNLNVDLNQFPVETVTYFTPGYNIKGLVSLTGQIQSPFSKTTAQLKGQFRQLRVEDEQTKESYNGSFTLNLKKSLLVLDLDMSQNKKDFMILSADIPMKMQLYPFKLHVDEKESAAARLQYQGAINPFVKLLFPPSHFLDAHLNANLTLKGTLGDPALKGSVQLTKGYYENLFIGLVLKNVQANMVAKNNRLVLETFKAEDSDQAPVDATGFLSLSFSKYFPFSIDLNVHSAHILHFDFLSAAMDGSGTFEGNFKKAHLKGSFDVTDGEIYLPGSSASNLPKLDVTYLYKREDSNCNVFQRASSDTPIYFDIDLKTKGNLIIRGRGVDSSWSGKVAIQGTGAKPLFKGKLTNDEGTFDFAGRLFELTEGTIHLNGPIDTGTSINLSAAQQIEKHQILIHLKGPVQGPYLNLRSEPSLSKREILALVLFGQIAERLTPFQAVALTHTLASLSGAYYGPSIVDRLRKGIGIDQLSLGSMMYDNSDYTTVQVGKYITRSILITLHRPITAGPSPFVITAQIRGGFQLQTFFDELRLSTLLLQWRFSY